MAKRKTPCGELLQGKNGEESIIILEGTAPFYILQQVLSNNFELEPPAPWDKYWVVIPKLICDDGCDPRSLALDIQARGIDIKLPPTLPVNTPTFQEVFGIEV